MSGLAQGLGGRQNAFWFYLLPVTIMAVVFWLFARDAPGMTKAAPLGASLASAFRDPVVGHLSLFYFLTFGGSPVF
jgi:nitrate/nitrite transporter NarK